MDAWTIALGSNPQLRASRQTTSAAGFDLSSSRRERLPQIQTINLESFLTNPISLAGSSGQPKAAPGGQQTFTISAVAAIVPIYTGGRIRQHDRGQPRQLGAARADEVVDGARPEARRGPRLCRRAPRGPGRRRGAEQRRQPDGPGARRLQPGQSGAGHPQRPAGGPGRPRQRPAARDPGAQPAEHRLGRLQPLPLPPDGDRRPPGGAGAAAARRPAGRASTDALLVPDAGPIVPDEAEIYALSDLAMHNRPELASLSEQAHAQQAQAEAERAKTRPQVSFLVANIYQNARFLPTEADTGAAAFVLNWTLFDGGRARRHSMAIEQRAAAQISRRSDLASAIRLEVRSAWLTCRESERRIPVARAAIAQAEENLRVARGRYLQQRGTNTEVLDAESARVPELRQLLQRPLRRHRRQLRAPPRRGGYLIAPGDRPPVRARFRPDPSIRAGSIPSVERDLRGTVIPVSAA